MATALALLRDARSSLDHGDNDTVTARVYRALETLAGAGVNVPDGIRDARAFALEPEVAQRLHKMLRGFTPLLHVGRHATWNQNDATGKLVAVTRSHAAFTLGFAELIVGWCATMPPKP